MTTPHLRPGTLDDFVAREQFPSYQTLLPALSAHPRVLDLGGHVGLFTLFALEYGASHVTTVEPHPGNVTQLLRNVLTPQHAHQVTVLEAAVVATLPTTHRPDSLAPTLAPTTTLYVNPGRNQALHTTVPTKGRTTTITVPAFTLPQLLGVAASLPTRTPPAPRCAPSVPASLVKCDVEGAEYDLLPDLLALPPTVTHLALELHLKRRTWKDAAVDLVFNALPARGWRPLRHPGTEEYLRTRVWTSVGVWERDAPPASTAPHRVGVGSQL